MQNFMRSLALAGTLATALGGCAALGFSGGVNVSVSGANYTDDYLDFTIYSASGKNLGIGGRAKKFAAGGTGGVECCAVIPNPGGTIRIKWKVGEDEVPHTKDIVVLGRVAENSRQHSNLIVRFFSQNEVEAEVIDDSLDPKKNLREDRLFLGIRQMRQKGE